MHILIIDDDKELCNLLQSILQKEGHYVDCCNEGDDGLRLLQDRAHDLVLLDRMLPCLDGLNILRIAREMSVSTPVIMMTALGSIDDKVDGLDLGADDYIVKPFSTKELIARMNAISRRPQNWSGKSELFYGDMQFIPGDNILCKGGQSVFLSKRESDLLQFFFKSNEKTLPRSTLISYVWGADAIVEEGNLDTYIHFLRKHMKDIGSSCQIVTVRNVGYQMKINGTDEHV